MLGVIALDAADYKLLQDWDCSNILLSNHRELEVYNHRFDIPYTLEVWPTVATGKHASEFAKETESEWQNPVLKVLSQLTKYFPRKARYYLGKPFRDKGNNMTFPVDESLSHCFEAGAVKGWPLISKSPNLHETWQQFGQVKDGELSFEELRRDLLTNFSTSQRILG